MWTNHNRNQKHHLHRHLHQLYFQIPFPALLFTSPTPNLVQSCDGLPLVCLHDSSKQHNSLAMVAAKKCLPCLLLNKREKNQSEIFDETARVFKPHTTIMVLVEKLVDKWSRLPLSRGVFGQFPFRWPTYVDHRLQWITLVCRILYYFLSQSWKF